MLRLLVRRARVQWPMLAALLVVVTIGATLLGTCALLVDRTADRAVRVAVSRADPGDVEVTAYTVTVRGPDARSVVADTRGVLTSTLAPFTATTAARGSSAMRSLPGRPDGVPAEAYLSGVEDLPDRAVLAAGRWPRAATGTGTPAAPHEAVVLEPTARQLGLAPGSRVHLGPELSGGPVAPAAAVDVVVVGVVRPLPNAGWDRDPLGAAGYDLAFGDGRSAEPVHAYGPFVVDVADLLAGGSTVDRLEITARPDLSAVTFRELDTVAAAVRTADPRLTRAVGDRVQIGRVASRLPSTLRAAEVQQRITTATVLAVALLGGVLTAAALALAGRLTAGVRADETTLLSALGLSRGQFATAAMVEAGALAGLAAALAIPASAVLHAGLTRMPPLVGAGLADRPTVTGGQLLAVAGGALALAAVLVVRAARPAGTVADRRHRWEPLARSGADLLLAAFAAVGWWQLRAQPAGADARTDTVRLLAPALLLTAGAAVALRLVPPALRVAERLARRARGLVLPLAAFEAARRPQTVAAGLLIGLACAAGTFGVALDATVERSQHDQADLAVGGDLAVTLAAPPAAGQGVTVSAATGGVVSPVTDRGIAVGQWLGGGDDPPRLVAVDTTRSASLLHGRLDDGRGWPEVTATLAPPTRVTGVPVPVDAVLTLTGTATGAFPLTVTPRLMLQDATGLRTFCAGAPLPLDGRPYPLPACATADGLRLVAVALPVQVDFADVAPDAAPGVEPSRVAVTLTVPPVADPAGPAAGSPWTATSAPPAPGTLSGPAVTVTRAPAGTRLTMTAGVRLTGAQEAARTLVATAFPAAGPVPVAVSARFADELGLGRGSGLSLTLGTTAVPVRIVEVVPSVPSAPGAAAVLADLDTLCRGLAASGDLTCPVDAWWVGRPDRADAVERVAALHLGTIVTRAGETARHTDGPLGAGLPAALRLLVAAAALLLLAGVALHVTCDLLIRGREVARLRALGMTRREVRAVLLGQHVGVLLPLLAAGAVVGALATRFVAPLLVRSDTGAAPVPPALPRWPWAVEAGLLAVLLVGSALAVVVGVTVRARRADAAHLRESS
ncbi:FtsX-like permease family protein [Micromonospora zhanjiangensis]|uniref:FtsX-like permease family protein n=1 Tax=Micromonospora zhanjiangensis TaxID=1522057 RepID=A0ABV8KWT3_9ACTN